jgi:arylsulfatase A-like enzyme
LVVPVSLTGPRGQHTIPSRLDQGYQDGPTHPGHRARMPRVRPRLRLALLLCGGVAVIASALLLSRLLPGLLRSHGAVGIARRVPVPEPVPEVELRAAFAPQPELALDLANTDVLLAVVCTFRRDRLQPYGQQRSTTPFLQLMAEHGVIFEHAIVQSPWTRPSTGSLLTGRWSEVLQLDDPGNAAFHNRALSDDFTTLAEQLQAQGYRTIGASGNPNISSTFGFDQGFDVHHEPETLWRDTQGTTPTGAEINTQLLAELDATPAGQRVFLQGFYVDTHAPRRPAAQTIRSLEGQGERTPRRVTAYDAALLGLDAHLAQLYLEVKRRRPNLLLVVVGDHGEGLNFPQHHGQGHGNYLYTSAVEVPFLWFHPALPDQGRRIDGLAMGIDLVPTLLDLLGTTPSAAVDGASQAPALRADRDRASHQLAFTQTYFRRSDKTAVFGQGYHLIRDRKEGQQALFGLDEALEETDLAGNHPSVVKLLSEELDRWERAISAAAEQGSGPVDGSPSSDMVEQLRTLGYVD